MSIDRAISRSADDPSAASRIVFKNVVEWLIPLSEEFCDAEIDHHHGFRHVVESHDQIVWFDVSKRGRVKSLLLFINYR